MRIPAFAVIISFTTGVMADNFYFAQTLNFDNLPTGASPAGWTATQTGQGNAKWEIVPEDSAPSKPNVLKQSGNATYPLCINDNTSLKDGFVEVKFKPVAGKEDQAGGLIWRCQNSNNYYVARANALEDNVCVYYTVKGRRTERKRITAKVASNQWHTLRADFKESYVVITFDGKRAIGWKDDTFKEAGKIGLWTKADSTTLFDDFSYGTEARLTKADLDEIDAQVTGGR
jgi:hypothetical protein